MFGPSINRGLSSQAPKCSTSYLVSEPYEASNLRTATRSRPAGRSSKFIPARAEFRPQQQTNQRRNLPPAPPARTPPPPPPPPPPPSPPTEQLNINISRRGLAAIMFAGTAAWYGFIKAGVPLSAVDRQRGIALLKTKKGNILAATQDTSGRIFMFDKAGNIYYDTEDPRVGMYIVDKGGEMYNEFVDSDGKVQQIYVGNIGDLRSIKVEEVGGIRVEELQRSVKGFKGGRVVGFPKAPDAHGPSWENLMPPTAPAGVPRGGGRIQPPPFLEDLEVELEPSGNGLFGKSAGKGGPASSPAEILKSLRREK